MDRWTVEEWNMVGARIKIMWEEQLFDPPTDFFLLITSSVQLTVLFIQLLSDWKRLSTEMLTGCLRMITKYLYLYVDN